MKLKIIGTGSDGNCYALESDNEILLLDLGLSELEIKKGINFNISKIAGCIVTHHHEDHAKSAKKFENMYVSVYKPYEYDGVKRNKVVFRNFSIYPIPMLDKEMKTWQHSDQSGNECKCYGFLIIHPEIGKLLYITDTKLIIWNFKEQCIDHILIGTNYDENYLTKNPAKKKHVLSGHLSLNQSCEFVRQNATNNLKNIIMCHLSDWNSDDEYFINEMKKVALKANVYVAKRGMTIDVNEVPF
jgi:phosphoribosyl 1,2-cyclic phosphodiesterase